MKPKILIVEDGKDYQLILKSLLEKDYDITFAESSEQTLQIISKQDFDLFLLDIVLPDSSGLQICNYLRAQKRFSKVPIIMVTSKDSHEDTIKSLEFGADDHISKPFDAKELLLRVAANLRRSKNTQVNKFTISNLSIDKSKQEVRTQENELIELTRIEFKLLVFFAEHIDHVIAREQLLNNVWPDNLNIAERTVDTHISNLRKKIGTSSIEIKAVHGSGYRARLL